MYEIRYQHEDGREWGGRSHDMKELAVEEAWQLTSEHFDLRAFVADETGRRVWHSHHYELLVEGGGETWRTRYQTGERDVALRDADETESAGEAEGLTVRNAVTGELIHEWWSPEMTRSEVEQARITQEERSRAATTPHVMECVTTPLEEQRKAWAAKGAEIEAAEQPAKRGRSMGL